jgi:hypothetical protein
MRRIRALRVAVVATVIGLLLPEAGTALAGTSLRGSVSSVRKQYRVAREHNFTFLRNGRQIRKFVNLGLLVPVPGNANYELYGVSYHYARPAVRTFIERLSREYRGACGEKLVITSLTRPASRQPRNASRLSVHPTGMAIDIRLGRSRKARRWMESTLLALEARGVIEATREHRPPHLHVAVFPKPYLRYVAALESRRNRPNDDDTITHRVAEGDTLWAIAQRYNTTVRKIKKENQLRTSRIYPGQKLHISP